VLHGASVLRAWAAWLYGYQLHLKFPKFHILIRWFQGITHYNNIKDQPPKEKKERREGGVFKRKQKIADVAEVEESGLETGADQVVR
jgi:hypothetical protein